MPLNPFMQLHITRLWSQEPGTFAPRKGARIDTIVVHYTATENLARESSPARGLLLAKRAAARRWVVPEHVAALIARYNKGETCSDSAALCMIAATRDRTASWHYCISSLPQHGLAQSEVVEYVPTVMQAHHVGSLGLPTNLRSIGIECVYPGALSGRKTEAEATDWFRKAGWKGPVEKRLAPDGVRRWYVRPAECQVQTLKRLLVSLCFQYETITAICSHYLFSPKHRTDPDPPYDLADIRSEVGGFVGRTLTAKPPKATVSGGR